MTHPPKGPHPIPCPQSTAPLSNILRLSPELLTLILCSLAGGPLSSLDPLAQVRLTCKALANAVGSVVTRLNMSQLLLMESENERVQARMNPQALGEAACKLAAAFPAVEEIKWIEYRADPGETMLCLQSLWMVQLFSRLPKLSAVTLSNQSSTQVPGIWLLQLLPTFAPHLTRLEYSANCWHYLSLLTSLTGLVDLTCSLSPCEPVAHGRQGLVGGKPGDYMPIFTTGMAAFCPPSLAGVRASLPPATTSMGRNLPPLNVPGTGALLLQNTPGNGASLAQSFLVLGMALASNTPGMGASLPLNMQGMETTGWSSAAISPGIAASSRGTAAIPAATAPVPPTAAPIPPGAAAAPLATPHVPPTAAAIPAGPGPIPVPDLTGIAAVTPGSGTPGISPHAVLPPVLSSLTRLELGCVGCSMEGFSKVFAWVGAHTQLRCLLMTSGGVARANGEEAVLLDGQCVKMVAGLKQLQELQFGLAAGVGLQMLAAIRVLPRLQRLVIGMGMVQESGEALERGEGRLAAVDAAFPPPAPLPCLQELCLRLDSSSHIRPYSEAVLGTLGLTWHVSSLTRLVFESYEEAAHRAFEMLGRQYELRELVVKVPCRKGEEVECVGPLRQLTQLTLLKFIDLSHGAVLVSSLLPSLSAMQGVRSLGVSLSKAYNTEMELLASLQALPKLSTLEVCSSLDATDPWLLPEHPHSTPAPEATLSFNPTTIQLPHLTRLIIMDPFNTITDLPVMIRMVPGLCNLHVSSNWRSEEAATSYCMSQLCCISKLSNLSSFLMTSHDKGWLPGLEFWRCLTVLKKLRYLQLCGKLQGCLLDGRVMWHCFPGLRELVTWDQATGKRGHIILTGVGTV